MAGPHARAVPCPLCHEKFFPKSLPFHQKQCQRRQAARRVNCPYCNVEVSALDLPAHVGQCPRSKPKGKGRGGTGGSGGGPGGGNQELERAAGPAQYDPEVLEDGRMRCIYCGRCFTSDRIDKHQQICGKLKSARPKGLDGQPTQTEAKIFDSTAQRLGTGHAFCSPEQYQRRQAERARTLEKSKAKTQNNWRRQHAEFQAACKAGRGDPAAATAPLPPRAGLVTCPHCSRQFDRVAADRHIPICAKVVNRPKPPPTPARQPPTPPGPGSWRSPANAGHGGSTLRPPTSSRHAPPDDYPHDYHEPAESARSSRLPPSTASSPQRTPGRKGGAGGRGLASSASTDALRSTGRRPSASEGTLPRIPGRRGMSSSVDSLRPPREAGEGADARAGGRRGMATSADSFRGGPQGAEGSPTGRRGMAASVDSFRAPSLAEGPPGSAGSSRSRASSGGTGLNAARSLRQRRPPAGPPTAERPLAVEELGTAGAEDSDSDATWRPDLDVTAKQHDTPGGQEDRRPPVPQQRLGLRRSALLYRLLSQLPAEALRGELGGTGVEAESLDQEGLIEAIADQLC